jgi:threonyl-tRNA synthetase
VQLVKDRAPFQRVVVSRDEALAMFEENKFKVSMQKAAAYQRVHRHMRCFALQRPSSFALHQHTNGSSAAAE